jgi:predicted nuclease of predicted toxin-antitoxin system
LIRFAADEDLDNHIVRAVRRSASIDIVRVQEARLTGADDDAVLAWAASDDRVLLTHDASTMTAAAYRRIERGQRTPGVIVLPQWLPVADAVADVSLIAECSDAADWADKVRFLPLP